MRIGIANLAEPDIRDLLSLHQQRMFAASPPGTSFALDLSGLAQPDITILAARSDDALLGVAALRDIGGGEGELKSMRAADAVLRTGIGQALLDHVVAFARSRGLRRLLLETGTGPAFAPANKLYARNGFKRRGPFGPYAASGFNIFYERAL